MAAALRGFIQERREKEELIDRLIAWDTDRGGPTPEETAELEACLAPVDADGLRFVRDRGTRLQVVRPGQEGSQAGVLRAQDPEEFEERIPERARFADRLQAELETRYNHRLEGLSARLEACY